MNILVLKKFKNAHEIFSTKKTINEYFSKTPVNAYFSTKKIQKGLLMNILVLKNLRKVFK